MNLDTKFSGKGIEKNYHTIQHIYPRPEVLLGLKLLGHTDTLTEASNLLDKFYKRGGIQN